MRNSTYYILLFIIINACTSRQDLLLSTVDGNYRISTQELRTFGDLRNQINIVSCKELKSSQDSYLLIELNSLSGDQVLPVIRSYCGESDCLRIKDRNLYVVEHASDFSNERLTRFVMNNGADQELSESPHKALLILDLPQNTTLNQFDQFAKGILSSYYTIWDTASKSMYLKEFRELKPEEAYSVIQKFPINVKIRQKKGDYL